MGLSIFDVTLGICDNVALTLSHYKNKMDNSHSVNDILNLILSQTF